jgi:hypothetical protein
MVDDNGQSPKPMRRSVPTPYIDHDDAIVMIDPTSLTRFSCIDAAVELGMRPVSASAETAARVVATVRPLVIVAERHVGLSSNELTDLAVGVGAQLVIVNPVDVGPALSERIKLSGTAARMLRSRTKGPT